VRSNRQAEHLAFARAERANLDAALAWSTVHQPSLALRIVNGFGWAWVVLGDSRGAQRILAAVEAAGQTAPTAERANALLLAAWIEASIGRLDRARTHIAVARDMADAINDVDLQARCCYYLAYVVSHDGDFRQAIELTDRSDAPVRRARPTVGSSRQLALRRRAAISANDQPRSVQAVDQVERWLRIVDDPWSARPPRRGARRTSPHPASLRRRRRSTSCAPRKHRVDSAFSRPRPTRSQPRAGAVPGR
jgi:hypothetical protein